MMMLGRALRQQVGERGQLLDQDLRLGHEAGHGERRDDAGKDREQAIEGAARRDQAYMVGAHLEEDALEHRPPSARFDIGRVPAAGAVATVGSGVGHRVPGSVSSGRTRRHAERSRLARLCARAGRKKVRHAVADPLRSISRSKGQQRPIGRMRTDERHRQPDSELGRLGRAAPPAQRDRGFRPRRGRGGQPARLSRRRPRVRFRRGRDGRGAAEQHRRAGADARASTSRRSISRPTSTSMCQRATIGAS